MVDDCCQTCGRPWEFCHGKSGGHYSRPPIPIASSDVECRNCDADIASAVKHLCRLINKGAMDNLLTSINACIERVEKVGGIKCQRVTSNRLACMKQFCRSGVVYGQSYRYLWRTVDSAGVTIPSECFDDDRKPVGTIYINPDRNQKLDSFDPQSINFTAHSYMSFCMLAATIMIPVALIQGEKPNYTATTWPLVAS